MDKHRLGRYKRKRKRNLYDISRLIRFSDFLSLRRVVATAEGQVIININANVTCVIQSFVPKLKREQA
jgi:hypothetical protein